MLTVREPLYPVLRGSQVPVLRDRGEITRGEILEVKRPWYKKKFKIEAVKLENYYEYVENKMITYQVIPHTKITGHNKRLWNTIHKMYAIYGGLKERVKFERFKVYHREKDYFWYDIVMRQEGDRKKIEFYVSTSEFLSVQLKRKIENMMQVTLKEVSVDKVKIPEENTDVREVKYVRHDIFSLNTHVTERQTPIASILNTVEELQDDGDMVRFSVCNEVEGRGKWTKNALWARERIGKGNIPQRANIGVKSAFPYIKTGVTGIVNEVYDLLMDTFSAVSEIFFKEYGDVKKEKVVEKGYTLEDEIKSTRLSSASLDKVNKPVFRTHIRVASHSKNLLTRDILGETMVIAVNDMAEDNELNGVKVRRPKELVNELNTLKVSKATKYKVDTNLMSVDEMSKMVLQMPTKEIQMKYVDEMNTKRDVEVVVPNVLQRENNLHLGYSRLKDEEIPVGLNTEEKDEFYCGYALIGKQGVGKDTALQNIVHEGALKHNISFIVMDWICESGHRGMADGIRDLLPPEKIVDIDLANEEWIVPMDLTEVIDKLGRKGGSRFALEMIDLLDLTDLPRSQKYLMEASKASRGSLRDIKRIIEEDDFRVEVIERLMSEGDVRTAKDLVNWGTNDELGNKCDAILSRLNRFFGDDTLHDIFTQPPKEEVNFEKWMEEGKTIIVRMPKRVLGNGSNVLAHWVTLKVLMTRMLMSDEAKERHGCFVLFNEPEQVESKGLAELMGRIATEGRKERLGSIFAFHHWDKLPSYLQSNLLAGGVNQLLFASDHKKTYENIKERLYPTFTLEEVLQTPKYHAIAVLNTKEAIQPFLMRMTPPVPTEERYDNSTLTVNTVKELGRRWEDLQNM